jgi:sugar phosphate isomerase/epimerase
MPTRRQFLSAATAATATAALAARVYPIEPIARNGEPKFKFSLAAYSYRKLLEGESPQMTLVDFLDECARFGLEGTELTSYYFPNSTDANFLRTLRRHAFRLGLDVSGTAIGNDFGHPPGEKRDAEIAKCKQWIENAAVLGAPVIRIFAGHQQKDQTKTEAHALMVSAMEECCEYAGKHGVHLALENHGGPTATAEGLLEFVRAVNSPWFGVNLDSGNFHSDDPYGELAQIAPYALNAQIKVVMSGPEKKKEPADYARLAKILREANYRGYVVLEYEEAGDVREECRRHLDLLREAFA